MKETFLLFGYKTLNFSSREKYKMQVFWNVGIKENIRL
jgi:hypothetical protein